ncbi:MAG: hypothetical protein QG567_1515, partial [Campylobacterota bacterium]|nr:hypothetical protein [Campylobacterota bacterium]
LSLSASIRSLKAENHVLKKQIVFLSGGDGICTQNFVNQLQEILDSGKISEDTDRYKMQEIAIFNLSTWIENANVDIFFFKKLIVSLNDGKDVVLDELGEDSSKNTKIEVEK